MQSELINHRRFFHKNAEVGFDTPLAGAYITKELEGMGLSPLPCGKSGVIADIGKNESGKRFLLRADFDALEIKEQTKLSFAAKNGRMHACGHDMHAAMLLGAARLLKDRESEITGLIRLMFQPAEETLCGARDMIKSGVLEPGFDGAMMLHVISGTGLRNGTVIIPQSEICAPSADFFEISVIGKGCHGAMVEKGINALTAGADIVRALEILKAQELGMNQSAALSIGCFQSGGAANIIPENAIIKGTVRAFDPNVREYLKKRIPEIAKNAAAVRRAKIKTVFSSGCPEFKNSIQVASRARQAAENIFGKDMVIAAAQAQGSSGSEDFAYISQLVPSVMVIIIAGNEYPQHHPKADFDESVLLNGAKLLTNTALLYAI